jgi:hypothetical protein
LFVRHDGNGLLAAEQQESRRWSPDDPDLVITAQPATQVYQNTYGNIVIEQEGPTGHEDDDPLVTIAPHNLPKLIAALKRYLP